MFIVADPLPINYEFTHKMGLVRADWNDER
jgi:hypothetical protein